MEDSASTETKTGKEQESRKKYDKSEYKAIPYNDILREQQPSYEPNWCREKGVSYRVGDMWLDENWNWKVCRMDQDIHTILSPRGIWRKMRRAVRFVKHKIQAIYSM